MVERVLELQGCSLYFAGDAVWSSEADVLTRDELGEGDPIQLYTV